MKILTAALGTLLLASAGLALQPEENEEAQIAAQIPTYPFEKCLVSDEPLDTMGESIDVLHEGKLVRFCCKGCVKGFKKDPDQFVAKIDAAVVKQQTAAYPLEACAISGESLGSVGDPVDMVHGTRLVRLCCKGCVKGFKKDPAKTMAKLDAAYIAAQTETYPMDACVISGEPLEKPVDVLYGNRLVRLCCKGCTKAFKKDPAGTVAKLDAAAKKKG